MDEAILAITKELQKGAVKVLPFTDPILGAGGQVIVAPAGWQAIKTIEPKKLQFPAVKVLDVSSFCRYVKEFGSKNSVAFSNESGIAAVLDYYTDATGPMRRTHVINLPAGWSPDTAKQVGAVKAALGKDLSLDAFELLIQTSALVIRDSTTLLEVVNDLEGTTVVKATRTRTGQSISLTGNVKGSIEIPKFISVSAVYMGEAVAAELPFRANVIGDKIQFQIIDNGALDAAMVSARKIVVAKVTSEIAPIALYEGQIAA